MRDTLSMTIQATAPSAMSGDLALRGRAAVALAGAARLQLHEQLIELGQAGRARRCSSRRRRAGRPGGSGGLGSRPPAARLRRAGPPERRAAPRAPWVTAIGGLGRRARGRRRGTRGRATPPAGRRGTRSGEASRGSPWSRRSNCRDTEDASIHVQASAKRGRRCG